MVDLSCANVDYSDGPMAKYVLKCGYMFFYVKTLDLLDTVSPLLFLLFTLARVDSPPPKNKSYPDVRFEICAFSIRSDKLVI